MVQKEMSLKHISYLELYQTICIMLVGGIVRNNSVKLFWIWISDSEGNARLKIFLIWSSGGPPLQWSGTIYAILNKGIMGNIHVK